jgi:hypothetical protein
LQEEVGGTSARYICELAIKKLPDKSDIRTDMQDGGRVFIIKKIANTFRE